MKSKRRKSRNQWIFLLVYLQGVIPLIYFYSLIALIPGSSIPSRYSSIAPPPVET